MKYRPSEQKQVDAINKAVAKLDKKSIAITNKILKLQQDQDKIRHERFLVHQKIYKVNDKVIKRCKHLKEYGRREWANCRDDASFSTYVGCKRCDEVMWDECYGPRGGY